jgi:hypothetical protein
MAVAIAQAESNRYVNVVNRNPSPPTDDLGLWQINDYYHSNSIGHATGSELYDADHLYNLSLYTASSIEAYNATAAFVISRSGANWTQWATFYNFDLNNHYADSNFAGYGAYKSYLGDARYWASLADPSSVLTGPSDNLEATQGVNVRNNPGGSAAGLASRVAGDAGVVLSGPSALTQVSGSGPWYIWWQVRWSDGEVGWSIENNLVKTGGSAPADLALQSITVTHGTYRPGDPVFIPEFIVKNVGGSVSASYTVSFYLSTDTNITTSDNYLGTTTSQLPGIAGGASDSYNTTVYVPRTLASRDYYVGAIINLTDANAANNTNYDPNQITITSGSTPNPSINTKPDFNNDGASDVLWQKSDTGERYVWLMNGTQYSSGVNLGTVLPIAWDMVSTGDFDGDSSVDILWRNQSSGECYIWLMNGTQFKAGVNLGTVLPTSWQIVGTGDFDGDGKVDILWQNVSSGERYIWLMNGTQFKAGVNLGTVLPTSWQIVGTGDFDGDGKVDILWQNVSSGERYVWLMNGTQFKAGVNLGTVLPTTWDIAGTGDFDRDGKVDIIWQNRSSGERYLWLMNGTQFKSGVGLGTVLPTTWNIRNR